jgi:heme-degrading monooxygenase HmoA
VDRRIIAILRTGDLEFLAGGVMIRHAVDHKLYMYLKNDGALAFKEKIEGEVIPFLRKQRGFLEQITFLYLNGREVQAFSLWETAEHAEAYNRESYPEVRRMLASVIEGNPRVETYEVLNSTMHMTCAAASLRPFDESKSALAAAG